MQLLKEIELLSKIYNTLTLISTKGQETIHMANCLNALIEVIHQLEAQNTYTVTIPIDNIQEELKENGEVVTPFN